MIVQVRTTLCVKAIAMANRRTHPNDDAPPSPRLKNPVFFKDPSNLTPEERAALWGGDKAYLRKVVALALGVPPEVDVLNGIPVEALAALQPHPTTPSENSEHAEEIG